MLRNLFAFPIVMVDGDEENEKLKMNKVLGVDDDSLDLDIIHGEVEVPYFDFIGIMDRWAPTRESRDNAKIGIFDHCMVMFQHAGTYMVPWTKAEFKKRISDFAAIKDKEDEQETKKTRNVRKQSKGE